jgi:hypothetical protein
MSTRANRLFPTTLAIVSMIAVCVSARQLTGSSGPAADQARVSQDDEAYLCPMHPDVISETPGTCPRCRMNLVLGKPFDMRDYRLELRSSPALVKAGEKTTLELAVSHPGTGEQVQLFTTVHEKRYHLFVMSQDLEFFEHIHPEQKADGAWAVDVTLPKPGYYQLVSDFVPFGGSAQFLTYPLVTAGYAADLVADSARLVPDTVSSKTIGDLTAAVTYDPPRFTPAVHSHMTFHLTRAGSGEPVTDLQTYLGAFGHVFIVSEDLLHSVHSHPIDMPPQDADFESLRGGPDVIFEALIPEPGRYRAWAQFRYHDTVHTFPFTFEVGALGSR